MEMKNNSDLFFSLLQPVKSWTKQEIQITVKGSKNMTAEV